VRGKKNSRGKRRTGVVRCILGGACVGLCGRCGGSSIHTLSCKKKKILSTVSEVEEKENVPSIVM
jgi:hypothetical protein